MATLPAFLRRTEGREAERWGRPVPCAAQANGGGQRQDPFQLRPLPHEDVIFFCKKIDNSRLVREPDPKAGGTCWSVIGGVAVFVVLLTGVLAPSVANTLEGYKLQALRAEESRLTDERRALDLQEAQLLSPERLQRLAQGQNLVTPASGQVVHLDGRTDATVAMVK
jgi:hypothetical protein